MQLPSNFVQTVRIRGQLHLREPHADPADYDDVVCEDGVIVFTPHQPGEFQWPRVASRDRRHRAPGFPVTAQPGWILRSSMPWCFVERVAADGWQMRGLRVLSVISTTDYNVLLDSRQASHDSIIERMRLPFNGLVETALFPEILSHL